MTSSFRPTTLRDAPDFVAIPLRGSIAHPDTFGFASGTEDARVSAFGSGGAIAEAPIDAPVAVEGIGAEEIEAREAEAYARGLEDGRSESASIDRACAALDGAAERLGAMGAASFAANREGLIALAASIARRWVGRELEGAPDAFVALLDRAVDRLPEDAPPTIRLAPADAERVEAARVATAGDTTAAEIAARWQVEADPALAPGEFFVEGARASIDGRAKAVLSELEASLSTALEAPEPTDRVDGADPEEDAS